MQYETYPDLAASYDLDKFEFVSNGKHGLILKRITFLPTMFSNVYNLAFGNIIGDNEIDDNSISDNGDRNKILATIANVIDIYARRYPERSISRVTRKQGQGFIA